jgi:hypothetical protein
LIINCRILKNIEVLKLILHFLIGFRRFNVRGAFCILGLYTVQAQLVRCSCSYKRILQQKMGLRGCCAAANSTCRLDLAVTDCELRILFIRQTSKKVLVLFIEQTSKPRFCSTSRRQSPGFVQRADVRGPVLFIDQTPNPCFVRRADVKKAIVLFIL